MTMPTHRSIGNSARLPDGIWRPPSLGLLALVWLHLGCLNSVSVPDPQPPLEVDPPRVDLGTILDAGEAVVQVVVRNRSAQQVEIADVLATLGDRVSYDLDRSRLEPAESALLQLYFDPTSLHGEVQLFVSVLAGDTADPQGTLEIRAMVEPCYRLEGAPVVFSKVIQGVPQAWRVAVHPRIRLEHALDTVVSDLPGIAGSVQYQAEKDRYLVDIVAESDLPVGLHQTILSLQSSEGSAPPCAIPVGATVQDPFRVVPDQLLLARTSREQFRMILLEHHVWPPLRVTGVQLPSRNCRFTLYRGDGPSKTWLRVYFYDVGRLAVDGSLTIHTDHPAHPTVTVPVKTSDLASVFVAPDCPNTKTATRRRIPPTRQAHP